MANYTMATVKELRELTGAGILDCKKALEANEGNVQQAVDWLREKGIAKATKKSGRVAAEGLSKILIDGNYAVIVEVNSETDFVAKNDKFLTLLDTIAKALLTTKPSDLASALEADYEGKTIDMIIKEAIAIIGENITLRRFEILEKSDSQIFGDYIHQGGKTSVISLLDGDDYEVARDTSMQVAAMGAKFVSPEDVDQAMIDHEREILRNQALNEGRPEQIVDKMVEGRIRKYYEEICLLPQEFFKNPDLKMSQLIKEANMNLVSLICYNVGEGIEKEEVDFAEEVRTQANL